MYLASNNTLIPFHNEESEIKMGGNCIFSQARGMHICIPVPKHHRAVVNLHAFFILALEIRKWSGLPVPAG
jgi:hypothetical protein